MAGISLTDLVETVDVADEDILLIRQGTEDKKIRAGAAIFSLDKYTDLLKKGQYVTGAQFTTYKDYLIYEDQAYSPLPATTLPYTVGAVPDLGFVYQIQLNSQSDLSISTASPIIGANLRKLGKVLASDASKDFMNIDVESPAIWWDDFDGYFHMVFTGYGDGTGDVIANPVHAKSKSLVDNWVTDNQPFLTGTGVVGDPDEYGGTGPYMLKHENLYYLFYIGLTEPGYEAGVKTLCLATTPTIDNPVWTRYGTVIGLGVNATDSEWRKTAVWHPSIVFDKGVWYLFFNASGTVGGFEAERIGYASSTDLINWTVDDVASPVVGREAGSWHDAITGDPSVYRQGDNWIMDFFGANALKTSASDGIAISRSSDFPKTWKITDYSPVLVPTTTGGLDDKYAHKPFIFINGGTKYHYYTSVSTLRGTRDISVAIDDADIYRRHYAAVPQIKEFITPNNGFAYQRFAPDAGVGAIFDVVHDALKSQYRIDRPAAHGYTPLRIFEINDDGVKINGNSALSGIKTVGTESFLFSNSGSSEVTDSGVISKTNNYSSAGLDKFRSALPAYQLKVSSLAVGGKTGVSIKYSTNTPTINGTIIWGEKWLWEKSTGERYSYDSGWVAVAIDTSYQFAHGLGRIPSDVKIQFGDGSGNILYEGWGFINTSWRFVTTDSTATNVNATNVEVRSGNSLQASNSGGAKPAATRIRILAN